MMKEAILFDLDGTLWDSTENIEKSWNEVLAMLEDTHPVTKEEMKAVMGLPMDQICRQILFYLPESRQKEVASICETYENEYIEKHGGILFEGVEEVLQQLSKKYFCAIVSNCQSGYIEAFLKHYGFERYFQDWESYGNTLCYKAENIQKVIERNQIDKAIYLGDIENDFLASQKAGVPFLYAAYGFGDMEYPDAIESFYELPKAAARLFAAIE